MSSFEISLTVYFAVGFVLAACMYRADHAAGCLDHIPWWEIVLCFGAAVFLWPIGLVMFLRDDL